MLLQRPFLQEQERLALIKKILFLICFLFGCSEDTSSWRKLNEYDPQADPTEYKLIVPIYSNDHNDLIHFIINLLKENNDKKY